MILFIWRCPWLKSGLSLQVNVVPRPVQLQPAISAHAEFVFCDQSIDISYIPTQECDLYLATIMDLYSRKIVGWAMADHLKTELPLAALTMALKQRQPSPGLLHHSDRGSQYTSDVYQSVLHRYHCQVSMSRVGNCLDNAAMESFFGTVKSELVHHRRYHTRAEARSDIFLYIEGFYNRRRRHSALGYLSPEQFERFSLN